MSNQKTHLYFAHSLSFFCAASLSVISQLAIADSTTSTAQVEEIIVTAGMRDQSIKDFSGSISVIKMDSLNPGASLSDIANQVPGLSVIDNGPRNITPIVMRGLRMDTVDSRDFIGDGSTVTSYVDNIPLQGFFVPPSFSLKDLQQVEVLRGPQGTLYGNASVGGLIRYITAKPDLTKNAVAITTDLSQTAESHGFNYDTDLVANMPIIADELGARVLLSRAENQGFVDNKYLLTGEQKDINSDQSEQVRASLLWKPTTEFSLGGSYEYQKNNVEDRQATNEEFTGDEYGASSRYLQPKHSVLRLASVDATYEFDWATLTASVNQSNYKTHTIADQTDYLLTLDKTYGWGYYTSYDQFSAFTKGDMDIVKDSAEIRFVSPDDQSLRWLAGVFASNDDLNAVVADRVPGFAAVFNEDRPEDLDYLATQSEVLREQSVYAEVAYDLTSAWEISLGGRAFREEDNAEVCSMLFPTSKSYEGNNYPLSCLDGDDVQRGSLGKFSSKYKVSEDQSVYLAITEGYRRGGTNFVPVETVENRNYKADTNVNYEIGTHSDFLDNKIQLNAAVFYIDWKDVQVKTYNADGYKITANAGAATSKGIELETTLQLMEELSASIGYAFTKAEISETVLDINGTNGNAYDGDRLPGSPREQWNFGFDYRRTVNATTWDAGLAYAYNTGMITSLNDSFSDYSKLDGYGSLNANIGMEVRNWRFGAYVNNLENERAITNRRLPDLYGEQGQFEYITRPRTIGLTVHYQF